jgi:hypothetical protein
MRTLKVVPIILALFVVSAPAAFSQQQSTNDGMLEQVIDKIIARERVEMDSFRQFTPLVETYIQNMKNEKDGAPEPAGDTYFIGRANFAGPKGVQVESLIDNGGVRRGMAGFAGIFSMGVSYVPVGFLEMAFLDRNGFDRENYKFDYVRREFLGEVRCLVLDVTPQASKGRKAAGSRFVGRIWVEDKDFTIVRFNGAYTGGTTEKLFFHFDSWRTNSGPNLWLPSFIYSEEKNMRPQGFAKTISFKAQTRLWGYNLGHSKQEQELGKILVEGNAPINDQSTTNNDVSPLQAQRSWDRQAEDNVIDRLERLGLIAPKGEVDKVLETVVNNLEVANNLDVQPEVRCRVLLNSTLESVSIGHTIILSRGLIDVLPDEQSLATVLAGELAHITLGHQVDTQFAFFDRVLMFSEKETFQHFDFARTKEEDEAASAKAAEYLNKSVYNDPKQFKDQLKVAQLFFGELQSRAKEIPNLISPRLGNALLAHPAVEAQNNSNPDPNQIVALPLGGRVKLDPWDDKLEMLKSKQVGSISEREKMPFEVTPFMLYLVRESSGLPSANINAGTRQDKDKNPQPQQHQ